MLSTQAGADIITFDLKIEQIKSEETIAVIEKKTGESINFSKKSCLTIDNIKRAEYRSKSTDGFYIVTKSIYDENVEFTDDVMPIINFHLDAQGKKKLAIATTQNVGKRMGIFINGKFVTAPVISEKIDEYVFSLHAAGVISVKEAKDIVEMINNK